VREEVKELYRRGYVEEAQVRMQAAREAGDDTAVQESLDTIIKTTNDDAVRAQATRVKEGVDDPGKLGSATRRKV
jgi:hypothetical protein